MANYIFETATQSDAAAYTSSDFLIFLSGSANDITVTHADATALQKESTTLSKGTQTLTFAAGELADSSNTTHHLVFADDSSVLSVGTNGSETIDLSDPAYGATAAADGGHARVYAFGGADSIGGSIASDTLDGGAGNDVIVGFNSGTAASLAAKADYLFGGEGADSITGSAGNDHIYGNSNVTTAGSADGNDTIDAGLGNDYVNGNAGNDVIFGNDGNDRLYGGAGNDSIGGGDGNDYLQGNKGNDTLDGGNGVDELHGGADNDSLSGGADNDILFGDNGNDTLSGGAGYDKLTGGAGNDTFTFAAGDSDIANVTTALTAANHGVTDQILDYVDGSDKIDLPGAAAVTAVVHTGAGVSFTDVGAAYTYAQQLIDADVAKDATHTHDVAAIQVGADTFLFYNDAGTNTINSVVKVVGVSDTVFGVSDFI